MKKIIDHEKYTGCINYYKEKIFYLKNSKIDNSYKLFIIFTVKNINTN